MNGGTYEQDLISGKITVEQVVDVDLAARATATTPAPSREALTQQATDEIRRLRETGSLTTDSEPTVVSGSRPDADPVRESKHWWNKVLHVGTIAVNAESLAIGGSVASTLLAVLTTACAAGGAILCAAVSVVSLAVALSLGLEGIKCLQYRQTTFYVKLPDFWNSHCGN